MKHETIKIQKLKPTKLQFSENLVRSHDYYDDEPSLTDQSDLKSSDINTIMEQYVKTGMLPVQERIQAIYADVSEVPSLETAFKIASEASELFSQLPAQVRLAMNNDASEMENFVSDTNNTDFLIKHGVLVEKQKSDGGKQNTPKSDASNEAKNDSTIENKKE